MSKVSSKQSRQVFTFQQSTTEPGLLTLLETDTNGLPTPAYTIRFSPESNPSISVARIYSNPLRDDVEIPVGEVSKSSKFTVNDEKVSMRRNFLSGEYSVKHATAGKLKWQYNSAHCTALELVDDKGRMLASFWLGGYFSFDDRTLAVMAPCDDQLLDLVVTTAMVAMPDAVNPAKNANARVGSAAGAPLAASAA